MQQDSILDFITKEKDVTWKNMLTNLVKTNQMDPWDIDVSILARDFLTILKTLEKMDFRVSGKVILAAAILLRMKSNILLDDYVKELDSMIASSQQTDNFYEELENEFLNQGVVEHGSGTDVYKLIPRTPQPRKRKVSIYDLMDALDKAIEVKERRVIKKRFTEAPEVIIPKKSYDLGELLVEIYDVIERHYTTNQTILKFSDIITEDTKDEKVRTLLPLLHLSNQRKINLEQYEHFGEIEVHLIGG